MKKPKNTKWHNSTAFYQPEPAPQFTCRPIDFDSRYRNLTLTADTIEIPAGCLERPDQPFSLALKNEVRAWLRKHYYVCRTFTDEHGVTRRYLSFGWLGPLLEFLEWRADATSSAVVRVPISVVDSETHGDSYHQETKYFLRADVKEWVDKNTPNYNFLPVVVSQLDMMSFFMTFQSEKDYIMFRLWWGGSTADD